jgi:TPR repeat protein
MLGAMIVAGAVGQFLSSGWSLWPSKGAPAPLVTGELASAIRRAESGDTAAEHQLAQMYAVGDGVPRDEKEAARWLERAARHGDADSQYEMGVALREGRGTVQDDSGAFAWLQSAADAGNAQAQFELGRMYFLGAGIPPDKIKAYTWLNLAAAQGAIGAASLRDVVRGQLTPDEIVGAQADARRLSEIQLKRTTKPR